MKIQEVNTPKGIRYIVLDNNYKVIEPIKEYLKYLDNIDKAQNTLKKYAQNLKIFYEFLDEENINLQDITLKDEKHNGPIQNLSNFIVWLQYPKRYKGIVEINGEKQLRSNKTVNHIMTTVLNYLDYLSKNGDLDKIDVYKELRNIPKFKSFLYEMKAKKMTQNSSLLKLKETKPKLKYITRDEYNLLFKATNSRRDKIIAALMFEGGLRISEVIGLHIEDLELWDNKINIVDRRNNSNGATVKNKAEGSVYIPDYVVELIQDYIIEDLVEVDTNFLIVNFSGQNIGQPMEENAIEQQYIALSNKVGIKIHPHMLRHGFATDRYNNGNYELLDIKDALRHKNIQSTMIYTDLTDDRKKELVRQYYDEIGLDFNLNEAKKDIEGDDE